MADSSEFDSYFKHRRIAGDSFEQAGLPAYLLNRLPEGRQARILDFGCGFGHVVRELARLGYAGAIGFDIEPAAIAYCRANGIAVIDGGQESLAQIREPFDMIIASHVLEHLPKHTVISTLAELRSRLRPGGTLLVTVPNAQSSTGAYWAYEDFTHHTLFTSGSLYYVLSKAGYSSIEIIDRNCTEGQPLPWRAVRAILMSIYRARYRFWNRVTGSATHAPSPDVFSYEVKAVASA